MKTFALLLLANSLLSSCYLSRQGYRQAELLWSRKAVDDVLAENNLSAEERNKLIFSKEALIYARSAGLNVEQSYRHYIKMKTDAVSYVVQAAKPTELKLKSWWFPIVGSVPYLGFFDRDDREKEAAKLEDDGYEVHRGSVAAYSSLGWFADPIYSSMLRRSDVELAHLYFHELTHRTVWLEDGVEFNENLAEFVADVLTNKFFSEKSRSAELEELSATQADYRLFKGWLEALRSDVKKSLDSSVGQPDAERIAAKRAVITLAISKKPRFKQVDFVGSATWNNARILAAGLYSPDTKAFEEAARCFAQEAHPRWVGNFLKSLKKMAETQSDGFSALKALCLR